VILSVASGALVGWGEAAPLPDYDGGDIDACSESLGAVARAIGDCDPADPDRTIADLGGELPPQARAALDTALRDIAAQMAGQPLWQALGGTDGSPIDVSCLIPDDEGPQCAQAAADASRSGFTAVKIKVGVDPSNDCAKLRAVRAAVGDRALVIADANGSLPADGLEATIKQLGQCGADVIEQPNGGLEWIPELADGAQPIISLDEAEPGDGSIPADGRVSAVCLKLQRCGGLDRLLAAAEAARRNGMRVYIGSTLEGPIGIAAALHAAAVIRPDLPSGLATLDLFAETESLGWAGAGRIGVPPGLGLGVGPDGRPR